jgi:hypothetical protein
MRFIRFHVKFLDGSSISVLKNTASRHKNLQLQIEQVSKSQMYSKTARPILFHIPFYKLWCAILSGLGTPEHVRVMSEFFKMAGAYSKE